MLSYVFSRLQLFNLDSTLLVVGAVLVIAGPGRDLAARSRQLRLAAARSGLCFGLTCSARAPPALRALRWRRGGGAWAT